MTFHEWVEKWQIGPGMNDGHIINSELYSGFDGTVGEGWVLILDRLAADLVAMGWDRNLMQVKEKFGELRFSIGSGTDKMFERIDQAEEESANTCEQCGQPGVTRPGGWLLTLCDACDAKRNGMR